MTLVKRLIPCLDVDAGRVVKGVKFIDIKDAGDPVEIAYRYDQQGADELIFLDITASSDGRDTMVNTVNKIANQVFMPLTVGGGVRTLDDIRRLLNAGADKISINTAAIQDPSFIDAATNCFGSQCIVVAIDAKNMPHSFDDKRNSPTTPSNRWHVFSHGGRKDTGIDAIQWALQMQKRGAGEILLTSMDRDGTNIGYDLELTRQISQAVNIPVIASGGAGNLQHLVDAVTSAKADAVLAASIFHFAEYTIQQAKQYMAKNGITIRNTET